MKLQISLKLVIVTMCAIFTGVGAFIYFTRYAYRSRASFECNPGKYCAGNDICGGPGKGECVNYQCVCGNYMPSPVPTEIPPATPTATLIPTILANTPTPQVVAQDNNTLVSIPHPGVGTISGTFFIRASGFFDSEEVLDAMVKEMAQTGLDTIIVNLGVTIKDERGYHDFHELHEGMATPLLIKLAKKYNMKLFFSVGNFASSNIDPWTNKTDQDHLIGISTQLITRLKEIVSNSPPSWNLKWSDDVIAGFYLWPETDIYGFIPGAVPSTLPFVSRFSQMIKTTEPTKKIIISPWLMEWQDYATAYTSFFDVFTKTSVDIIAPQDSLGTGKVVSQKSNSEHLRALSDAAKKSGKEAWVNVESFTSPWGDNGKYVPSTIDKLSSQILTAQPYVSKIITFAYQDTMLSSSLFDTYSRANQTYTPLHEAQRRKVLRNEYLDRFRSSKQNQKMYVCLKDSKTCATTSSEYDSQSHVYISDGKSLCETNISTYLPNRTTGMCYSTLDSCNADCGTTSAMYFCNTDGSCGQTSAQYFVSNHRSFDNNALCEDNLFNYVKGKTSEMCYASLQQCQANCPAPQQQVRAKQLFYCNKSTKSCLLTSGLYDPISQISYNAPLTTKCSENLQLHLSGITTGVCYALKNECEQSCK